MRDAEHVLRIVHEWVSKAENDLTNAAHTLKLGRNCPTDTVCFHAQQCVEKYLKAVLVLESIDFPRTHDIRQLMGLMPAHARPALPKHDADTLTDYAAVIRYPGDYRAISLTEARHAVKAARSVRRQVRKLFPKKALRKTED